MIITRAYAQRLRRQGRARIEGMTTGGDRWPDEPHYVIVTRLDVQRVDHYLAETADYAEKES
jgi:hypothetical protein